MSKRMSMYLPKRELLSLRSVVAFPKASKIGLHCKTCIDQRKVWHHELGFERHCSSKRCCGMLWKSFARKHTHAHANEHPHC